MITRDPHLGDVDPPAPFFAAPAPADVEAPESPVTGGRAGEAGPAVSIRLEGLRKSFGACAAVDGVTLDVPDGELLAILGPSGCGKSTLLRLVAGLERQDAGRVILHGRDVGRLPPAARGCGVVFQSYALFPNLTAAGNVAFGIDRRRYARPQRAARARILLEQVGLTGEADRYPAQLSGGQQQRVALARALATEPSVLLLDEPLSALDAKVRAMLRVEIRRLQQATRLTTLLVTHDQEEAMTMADRVAVMNGGRLVQVDAPRGVYQRPADAFTAAFVGVMNLLDGWVAAPGRTVRRDGLALHTLEQTPLPTGSRVTVAFRPEEASIAAADDDAPAGDNALPCRIDRVEFRGPFVRHYVTLGTGGGGVAPSRVDESVVVDVAARDATALDARPGAQAVLRLPPEGVRIFRDERSAP